MDGSLEGSHVAARRKLFAIVQPLQHGLHMIYTHASDAQSGTSVNLDDGSAPLTGAITAYQFIY